MKPERHAEYINAVKALENELRGLIVTDFTLTAEEEAALGNVPEWVWEMHEESLSRFTPLYEDFDFRDAAFKKMLAIVYSRGIEVFTKAFKEGYEAGRET